MATAAALVLGIFLGTLLNSPSRNWVDYVASYQKLYSHSTLAHLDTSPLEQQNELDRVAASIGKIIRLEKLTVFPDVSFVRSQILSYEGQALIQLAFLTSTGDPVALCMMRAEGTSNSTPHAMTLEGMRAALWAQNGYKYMLVGGEDDTLITRMSSAFSGINI